MDIHLIRHPKTVAPSGTCYGATDLEAHPDHLNADIARNAPAIPDDARFVSSTQRRAMALAKGLAGDRPVTFEPRLVEMDFGAWENRQWSDLPREEIDAWAADTGGYTPPGGESVDAMAARVLDWWESMTVEDTPLVVVSHGGPLRLIAAHIVGSTPARSMGFEIQWGRRALVWRNPGRTVLAGWNLS
jgi:alpha-ribazole phosphatase